MSIKGYFDESKTEKFEVKFKVFDIKNVIKYLKSIENELKCKN